jgi:hypothetical protein
MRVSVPIVKICIIELHNNTKITYKTLPKQGKLTHSTLQARA